MLDSAAIATRLENSDYVWGVCHEIVKAHEAASGHRRAALECYARSAAWTIANADKTACSERTAAYHALSAVRKIVSLYP